KHLAVERVAGLALDLFLHCLLQVRNRGVHKITAPETGPVELFPRPQARAGTNFIQLIQIQVHHKNVVADLVRPRLRTLMRYDNLVDCALHGATTSLNCTLSERATRIALLTPSSWKPLNQ